MTTKAGEFSPNRHIAQPQSALAGYFGKRPKVFQNENVIKEIIKEDIKESGEDIVKQEKKSFDCEECGKQLNSENNLVFHKRTHLIKKSKEVEG